MRRNVGLLAVCQALFMTANVVLVATSALVGLMLAPQPGQATFPLGAQFLATMTATMPASLLMRRVGRRAGFLFGGLIGITGAVVCTAAIFAGSFAGFCAGTACIGVFNAFAQYYRFAAADVSTLEFRSRAISLVLAGGIVAAFAGPTLAVFTRELFVPATFAGSYGGLAVLYLLTVGVLCLIDLPPPDDISAGSGRPLAEVAREPAFLVAVLGAAVAFGVMNLLMTTTPLAMAACGFGFGETAFVIQVHILGMFAPAFVTGHLIHRFGILPIMGAGALLLGASMAIHLAGLELAHFATGLLLLGLGWNLLFIGSTTLLTGTYRPEEKAKAQGFNDLLVFGTVTLTAFSSGMLHHAFGWDSLNAGSLAPLGLLLGGMWWFSAVRRRTA